MVLIPIRSVRWGCNDSIYILKAGIEINIKNSDLDQAKASGLFEEIKEQDVKPIKRKTTTKSTIIE